MGSITASVYQSKTGMVRQVQIHNVDVDALGQTTWKAEAEKIVRRKLRLGKFDEVVVKAVY